MSAQDAERLDACVDDSAHAARYVMIVKVLLLRVTMGWYVRRTATRSWSMSRKGSQSCGEAGTVTDSERAKRQAWHRLSIPRQVALQCRARVPGGGPG